MVKLCLWMPAFPISLLVQVLTTSLPIPLPENTSGKADDDMDS